MLPFVTFDIQLFAVELFAIELFAIELFAIELFANQLFAVQLFADKLFHLGLLLTFSSFALNPLKTNAKSCFDLAEIFSVGSFIYLKNIIFYALIFYLALLKSY